MADLWHALGVVRLQHLLDLLDPLLVPVFWLGYHLVLLELLLQLLLPVRLLFCHKDDNPTIVSLLQDTCVAVQCIIFTYCEWIFHLISAPILLSTISPMIFTNIYISPVLWCLRFIITGFYPDRKRGGFWFRKVFLYFKWLWSTSETKLLFKCDTLL